MAPSGFTQKSTTAQMQACHSLSWRDVDTRALYLSEVSIFAALNNNCTVPGLRYQSDMLRFVEEVPVTRSKSLACATTAYSCRCAGLFELHLTASVPAGLDGGVKILKGIADKYEDVTYADIFQLASAIAVKV